MTTDAEANYQIVWLNTKIHTETISKRDNIENAKSHHTRAFLFQLFSGLWTFGFNMHEFSHQLYSFLLACYLGKTVYATKVNFNSTVANKHRVALFNAATALRHSYTLEICSNSCNKCRVKLKAMTKAIITISDAANDRSLRPSEWNEWKLTEHTRAHTPQLTAQ